MTHSSLLEPLRQAFGSQVFWNSASKLENKKRTESLEFFLKNGIPSTRDEQWKYTDLSLQSIQNFKPAQNHFGIPNDLKSDSWLQNNITTESQWVFYNGFFSPELSRFSKKISWFTPFSNIPTCLPLMHSSTNALNALNTAFMTDGAYFNIPPNTTLQEPIYLVFIHHTQYENQMVNPKTVITIGESSNVTFIEHHISLGSHRFMTNSSVNIVLEKKSFMNHISFSEAFTKGLCIQDTTVDQKEGSQFKFNQFSFGPSIHRQSLAVSLQEPHSEAIVHSLQSGVLSDHRDTLIEINHNAPLCKSTTINRGVLDNQSKGAFTGKIHVSESSLKTNAHLETKFLLLSSEAQANSRPQLEIYHGDIQCSHGSAIGYLDQNALFYLRTRGLSEAIAKRFLITGFLNPVIESISVDILKAFAEKSIPW